VTAAAPHYLIADGVPLAARRTRAGDAWQARASGAGRVPDGPAPDQPVLLGMPAVGRPR
jgi:tRNA-2-methylthio-N6-dimethylallyladenosine synthase